MERRMRKTRAVREQGPSPLPSPLSTGERGNTGGTPVLRGGSRHGFTLLEGLLAAVVLAIAVVGILSPLTAASQQSSVSQQGSLGAMLAQQLVEEIASKPFADPSDGSTRLGPGWGETSRAQFDNVGDYHGYHDTTTGLTFAAGTAVNFDSDVVYTRSVSVEYRSTPTGTATSQGDFALVTVTVSSDHSLVQASRLMCRFPYSQ